MEVSCLGAVREFAQQHSADPAVRALLDRSQELPRVGACTLQAPIAFSLPDAHSVLLTWPAIGVDVDVIFLVHEGPLDARIRDRITAGPAEFMVVPSVGDIQSAWETIDPVRIERARMRSLWQGLASLGLEPPHVSFPAPEQPETVCVIGPCPESRERVAGRVRAAGYQLGTGADSDIVVAVAPERGWQEGDCAHVEQAFALVGRLVVTAPLPPHRCPDARVASEPEVVGAVRRRLASPPLAPLPEVVPAAWERSVARLERGGSGTLIDALVITTVVWVGLARVLPVGSALALALILGAWRLWSRRSKWRPYSAGASVWLRRKLAGAGSG